MCTLLHRLAGGPLPIWLVDQRDIDEAQRLELCGWLRLGTTHHDKGPRMPDDPLPVVVLAITFQGLTALEAVTSAGSVPCTCGTPCSPAHMTVYGRTRNATNREACGEKAVH